MADSVEEKFLSFVRAGGAEADDRRPSSARPLPHREPNGYAVHDFARDCRGICVHHSASRAEAGGGIDAYARYHMERWTSAGGLAYTIAIRASGIVTLAWNFDRRLYSQGWADVATDPATLGDENRFWKGVLVDGDMRGPLNPKGLDQPTLEQMHALELVRAFFWTLGKCEVTGHFEHGKPACPGERLQNWVTLHRR